MSTYIKETDCDNNYRIFHYIRCDENSEEIVKQNRGVIINNNGNIVCKSFDYTQEILSSDHERINSIINNTDYKYKFYNAEEVSLIRAWFHDHRWHLSTHKKVNAYYSKWGSDKSFGELFTEAIHYKVKEGELKDKILYELDEDIMDCFFATLNTDRVYAFILRTNSENRVVCKSLENPQVYFSGEFDTKNFKYIDENTSGIERPLEYKFESSDKLIEHLQSIDIENSQGLMVYKFSQDGELVQTLKIVNDSYLEFYNSRGNCPDIPFRYLQVRNNNDFDVFYLMGLYPEYTEVFMKYEEIIFTIIKNIHKSYLDKFINKTKVVLPNLQYIIMENLHQFYLNDRKNNKITFDIVNNYINNLPPTYLGMLINTEN